MGIKWCLHVVYHPEDGLAISGLAETVTFCCVVHLFHSEFTCVDERLEEVEVVSSAGINHGH